MCYKKLPNPLLTLFLLIFLAVATPLFSQSDSYTRSPLSIKMHQLAQELPPHEMVDVLIKGNPDEIMTYVQSVSGMYKYAAGNLVAARIPAGGAESSQDYGGIQKIDPVWGKIVPLDGKVDTHNNVWQVRQGIPPLDQAYKGKDVVIGFLDTGLDMDHPDFWNADSTSRVKYYWDQTDQSGPQTPVQFGYGSECDSTHINSGQCSHTDNHSHGTQVAGLATGNGNTDSNFTGVAPEADIVVVKVDLEQSFLTRVVDGVNYILKKAKQMGKPVVINASLGTYVGSHDGQDLAAQAIDYMLNEKPGRMMVCAAGNEGDVPFHLGYDVTDDTSFTWFKYNSSLGAVYMELWADTADFNDVSFRISADAPQNYDCCYKGPFFNIPRDFNVQADLGVMKDSIISLHGNCIGVASYYVELIDDRYVIDIVIQPDSTDYLFRLSTTGEGRFDLWSHPSLTGTSQMVTDIPSITTFPPIKHYKMPDNEQTMVSSWACSPSVLTVGSYVSRESYLAYNGNTVGMNGTEGAPEATSSLGPTRSGLTKPDIIASGQNAMTTLPLWKRNNFLNNNPGKLASSGWHTRFGGTSSSSPIAAGAVALYLEQNPTATPQEIITAFTETARQDSFTGQVSRWKAGHGKLNVLGALTVVRGCTDSTAINYNPEAIIDDGSCEYDTTATGIAASSSEHDIIFYPNPVSTTGMVHARVDELNSNGRITIYNIEGQQLLQQNFHATDRKLTFDMGHLPGGVYLVKVFTANGNQRHSKIIKP